MMQRAVRVLILSLILAVGSGSLLAQQPRSQADNRLDEPVQRDPRVRAKLHTELGALYFQDGNIPVAMEELTVAIYIDSTYAPAYGMRALVHHYLKEYNHAEDNFRDALRYGPDDPDIANNYGWFLCQIGKYKEGMAQFDRALRNRLYQTPDRAYLNAGQCALAMGDLKLAEENTEKAVRFSGGLATARLQLAQIYFRTDRLEEARREANNLLAKVDPNAELLWLAIRIERKVGDRDAEQRHSIQLRRKFPTSPEYQALLKGNYE